MKLDLARAPDLSASSAGPGPMNRMAALAAATEDVDVAIVGAGVTGAAAYRELCQRGYRVLLVDRGDFASGTSQASGMLIWGGLLYLKNLDLRTVWKLCHARDRLLSEDPDHVETLRFRYLPLQRGGRSRRLVQAALFSYWMLGGGRRRRPYGERGFHSSSLLRPERFAASLVYEEACLPDSDSRFVLSWIVSQRGDGCIALNHCELQHARWEQNRRSWRLELTDRQGGASWSVRARVLINAAGVWAERVGESCGLEQRYRHVLSKGVYLTFARPAELDEAMAFEMEQHGDTQTFTPWGPVALWGPTESVVSEIEAGLRPDVSDVRFLLSQANSNLREQRGVQDIVSLRCGIRPLAVERSFARDVYPLDLSRRHVVARDRTVAALTIFGGKLTSAPMIAREVSRRVGEYLLPRGVPCAARNSATPSTMQFPGIDDALPSPRWCVEHEGCVTLEDYLRRRTNIAQWVPRLGLGIDDCNLREIVAIAEQICGPAEAARAVANWRSEADRQDQLLASV